MKSEILVIAEAILANTQILRILLDKLPDAVKAEVAAKVEQVTPVAAPVVTPVKKPVEVEIPVLIPSKVVEVPAPIPVAVTPVPVVVPVAVTSATCPITNGKELMDYVMSSFKSLGSEKGARIQEVLNGIGCAAINEVRADQYAALYAGIEALKAA